MHLIKKKSVQLLTIALSLTLGSAFAQTEQMGATQKTSYSDKQVESFVAVADRLETVQEEMMKKIEMKAEAKGLDIKTFQAMAAAKQGQGNLNDYTPEQQKAFNELMQEAQSKQQSMMMKVQEIVKAEGMDMMTFQQMAMQAQSDEGLKKRIEAEQADGE